MPTIEIDEEVYEAVRLPEGERSQAMKEELAISLYARDILSFGKARACGTVHSTSRDRMLSGFAKIERQS